MDLLEFLNLVHLQNLREAALNFPRQNAGISLGDGLFLAHVAATCDDAIDPKRIASVISARVVEGHDSPLSKLNAGFFAPEARREAISIFDEDLATLTNEFGLQMRSGRTPPKDPDNRISGLSTELINTMLDFLSDHLTAEETDRIKASAAAS